MSKFFPFSIKRISDFRLFLAFFNLLALCLILLTPLILLTSLHTAKAQVTSSPQASSQASSPWVDEEFVSVRLIAASNTSNTGEKGANYPLIFGLEFQLAENWKVYWRSAGDAGYPPTSQWATSENVANATMLWPAPVRFSVLGFETLGYKHEVVYPLHVTPQNVDLPVTLSGEVDFLVCADICIPLLVDLSLSLPSGDASPSTFAHLINKYTVRVPGDGVAHGITFEDATLYPANQNSNPTIGITLSSLEGLPFINPDVFMEGPAGIAYGKPKVTLRDGGRRADLFVEVFDAEPDQITDGTIITATIIDRNRSGEKTLSLTPASASSPVLPSKASPSSNPGYTILAILAIAFMGGLILNIMPCVLPVLSIKLLGVIKHGGSDTGTIRKSFLASAAGIITSFMIIAGILALLKLSGATIGWGIQFQHPWFLISMALIITLFACNLLGWFEFNLPSKFNDAALNKSSGGGLRGHFATGMLATLLATPCSAPFLGTAVGFALSRGTVEIMGIFFVLGLGLSTPYLIVAAAPRMASALPKPGQWMVTLQRVLGVALLGTTIWLLSVLVFQIGELGTIITGGFILCIVIILYGAHRFKKLSPRISRINRIAVLSLVIFSLATPFVLKNATNEIASIKPLDQLWLPFDQTVIDAHTQKGQVVFVDVTADWCITCQVNKKFVLYDDEVFAQLTSENISPMQADWTLPNKEISTYLATFQRYGIPFNAVYGPAAPQGIALPELLTIDTVIEALNAAKG